MNLFGIIKYLNLKTIYFNFKYFTFQTAIKFPVFVAGNVYLREVAGQIKFECPVYPGIVRIGYGKVGIFDDKRSRSIWEVSGQITFKGTANIGHGSKISVGNTGNLVLGHNFRITAESSLVSFLKIQVGDNCLLSWDILVMDTDFHTIMNSNKEVINSPQPIIIGNNVLIYCRSLILKGAVIPDNCVIGANSLVNKALPYANALYAGSPANCIKENISWEA